MKEYKIQENVIEIAMHESTESIGIDYDVYLNGRFVDGGIIENARSIPDVLDCVSRVMSNHSRYQMSDKQIEVKK